MPLLVPVTQEFDISADRYLAGIAAMLAGTDHLAESIDKVSDSSTRMGGVTEVADAAAVVAMEAATDATRDLTDATRDLAQARRRAADAGTGTGFGAALKNLFAGPSGWMKMLTTLPGILTAVAAGGPAAALAIASVIQAIAELGSIIGPAAIGLGAFAAFALPQLTAVTSGYGAVTTAQKALSNATTAAAKLAAHAQLKAAWASMDAGQRKVTHSMLGLRNEFQRMSKTFEPDVLKIFNMGLKDARILLPDVFKIAKSAAPAVLDALKRLAKDARSPEFKHFLTMMAKDAPHAIKTASNFLFGLARAVTGTARFFGRAAHDIKQWSEDIWKAVSHAFDNVKHVFDKVTGSSPVKNAMHIAGDAVKWFVNGPLAFIKQQIAVFSAFWQAHGKEIEKIARIVWQDISLVVRVAWDIIKGILAVGLITLKTIWKVAWDIIYNVVKTVWNVIASVVRTTIRVILDVIGIVLDLIQGHWKKAWNTLKDLASTALHGAITVIKDIASGFINLLYSAGKDLISGLINGIKSMYGAAKSAVVDLGHAAVSAAKSFFGIGSPSRVFFGIGQNLGAGLAGGITSSSGLAASAARKLATAAAYAASHAATLAAARLKQMHAIGLGLSAGILASLDGTASQVKAAVAKIAGYIAAAVRVGDIGYGRGLSMTRFIERDNRRLQDLARKRLAIFKTIQAAEKYATSTASSIASSAGLTNLASVSAASSGGSVLYSGDMLSDLRGKLAQIRQFAAAIRKLAKEGLSKGLLSQIIAAGPEQGLQIAQALLDGPISVIKQMNRTQAQITAASTALGRTAADLMYDSGKQAGKGFLTGLEAQRKAITHLMERIARDMVKTIRRELGISSASAVARWHGQMFAQGLALGMDDGRGQITASAARLALAMGSGTAHGGAGHAAGGGDTYNVHLTVNGFVGNNQQLMTELYALMQRAALQYSRRNRNNGLSLGR